MTKVEVIIKIEYETSFPNPCQTAITNSLIHRLECPVANHGKFRTQLFELLGISGINEPIVTVKYGEVK